MRLRCSLIERPILAELGQVESAEWRFDSSTSHREPSVARVWLLL